MKTLTVFFRLAEGSIFHLSSGGRIHCLTCATNCKNTEKSQQLLHNVAPSRNKTLVQVSDICILTYT